jgi:hypothetical protein
MVAATAGMACGDGVAAAARVACGDMVAAAAGLAAAKSGGRLGALILLQRYVKPIVAHICPSFIQSFPLQLLIL